MNNERTYKRFILYFCVAVCTLIVSLSTKTMRSEQKMKEQHTLIVDVDDETDLDFLDDLDLDLNLEEQAVLELTDQGSPCYTHPPKGLLEYIYAGVVYIKNALSRFFV